MPSGVPLNGFGRQHDNAKRRAAEWFWTSARQCQMILVLANNSAPSIMFYTQSPITITYHLFMSLVDGSLHLSWQNGHLNLKAMVHIQANGRRGFLSLIIEVLKDTTVSFVSIDFIPILQIQKN
jgi:hypothetical protein